MAELNEAESTKDTKKTKKEKKMEEKAAKKAAKKAKKNHEADKPDAENDDSDSVSSKIVMVLVTILIIAIWLGIFAVFVKADVGGFGSTVLAPALKDVPVLSKILPSLAPSILIMLTSFTRIIIVLHFVRTAIGTQTAPPNQVLVGLALFLTLFIMWPTFSQVNEKAIKPLDEGKITQQEAIKEAEGPFREFMYGQTQTKDIKLFVDISGDEYDDYDDVPFTTLVPAFILSELRTAFILGFLIYIPFIVIDMVVSSVLMSMGMMMLPPTTISMPFKVLLFILADGWDLVVGNLVKTFY